MQQPKNPVAAPPLPPASIDDSKPTKTKRQPPTPEEVLSFYESQGLDHRAASLKAIEDLQSALLRGASASASSRRFTPSADVQRKLDNANTRLAVLDVKLDSKPGYPQSLAIGLASGALLHGLEAAIRALAETWRSVTSATKSHT